MYSEYVLLPVKQQAETTAAGSSSYQLIKAKQKNKKITSESDLVIAAELQCSLKVSEPTVTKV